MGLGTGQTRYVMDRADQACPRKAMERAAAGTNAAHLLAPFYCSLTPVSSARYYRFYAADVLQSRLSTKQV